MKRIQTRGEIDRAKKRNAWIIGIFFISLMVFSTAGYALLSGGGLGGSNNNNNNNDGNDLIYDGNSFVFEKDGRQFYFATSIAIASQIPVDITFRLEDYYGKRVYLVAESGRSLNELTLNLGPVVSGMQEACYGACERDLPEKGCDEKLIIWRDSEENKVYQENQCIFIEGDLSAVDAFLYELVGLE